MNTHADASNLKENDVYDDTASALAELLDRHQQLFVYQGLTGPSVEFDQDWKSECIVGSKDQHNQVRWRPVQKAKMNAFTDMQEALETTFHASMVAFYSSHWADGIRGTYEALDLSLIQVWNEDDLDMLKQNMLGHAFAKKKARQDLTLFIGCTESNEILSILNSTGEIILERPGSKDTLVLAEDLASFLRKFTPDTRTYT